MHNPSRHSPQRYLFLRLDRGTHQHRGAIQCHCSNHGSYKHSQQHWSCKRPQQISTRVLALQRRAMILPLRGQHSL